jgi:hypothetical protein
MGIAIANNDEPPPCGIVVTLECDVASEFFCRGFETFQHPDGFIGCHATAMKAGWLERQTAGGRQWLCPACSGKS